MQNILVIKLSALGDFILSIGSMQAIRAHHKNARITLLTTPPFEALARGLGCFDEIWLDSRPAPWKVASWLNLARKLRAARFDRVYDLQRSGRTGWYFRLAGRPEWVGKVRGCAHRFEPVWAKERHIIEWEREQLARVGIAPVLPPDLSGLTSDPNRFGLPGSYALLVPGSAPHRPGKRWPAASYAALARRLAARGILPVLIGGKTERAEMQIIVEACPEARDLGGQTDLFDIAGLARGATVAVGNDTGPTHVIAAAGCPVVALFSEDSDPVRSRPPWPAVEVLRAPKLADLSVERVEAAVESALRLADTAANRHLSG